MACKQVVNLRDLLKAVFNLELAEDITWHLLPLGLDSPIDPIDYLSGRKTPGKQSVAVRQFLAQIASSTQALESQKQDTGRLLTVFKVKLESRSEERRVGKEWR